jgi:hypothetical protein
MQDNLDMNVQVTVKHPVPEQQKQKSHSNLKFEPSDLFCLTVICAGM